jgi:hypothetical protein
MRFFYRGPCGTPEVFKGEVCGHRKRMHTWFGGPCRFDGCKCQQYTR